MVMVSGGNYVLLTASEASQPIPLQPGTLVPIEIVDETESAVPQSTISAERFSVYITNENLVQNNLSPGEQFFYQLYEGADYESGLAEIVASGSRFLLNRKKPIYYFDGETKNFTSTFRSFSGPKLFLQVSPPEDLQETLVYGNSVPCSSSSGTIQSVILQNNTLLGCKDDEIQSIDGIELAQMFSDNIVSAIDGKNITINSVRILPSNRPVNPPRGTVILNNQSNTIEFYNGTAWVSL